MLRIDELAELGCCCFCSILYIGNEKWLAAHPEETKAFMRAIKRGADDLFADPKAAWAEYCRIKPAMNTKLHSLQFDRSFNYMSRDLANVQRDWEKVTNYSIRLGIIPPTFEPNMTNAYLSWRPEDEGDDAAGRAKQIEMVVKQKEVAIKGGVLAATVAA